MGIDPISIQSSHAYTAKNLALAVQTRLRSQSLTKKRLAAIVRHVKHLAREIELLSPAVDAGGQRLDNCEYPWLLNNGSIRVPAEHRFLLVELLKQANSRSALRMIEDAIEHYANE